MPRKAVYRRYGAQGDAAQTFRGVAQEVSMDAPGYANGGTTLQAERRVRPQADSFRPIAIVDDSLDDMDRLKSEIEYVLGPCPYVTFPGGLQLLRYLDTHMKSGEKPRIIFLDLNMNGLDGLATLEVLHDRLSFASVPVIAVSGTRDAGQVRMAFRSGASAFLPKPVSRWDMMKMLQGKTLAGLITHR